MNQVVDAKKAYSNIRTLYCVYTNDKSKYIPGSQIVAVYDLDNDGIKRVGFPMNPFANNMFFKNSKGMVFFKYYNAFDHLDDIPTEYSEIDVYSIESDTKLVVDSKKIFREQEKKMN